MYGLLKNYFRARPWRNGLFETMKVLVTIDNVSGFGLILGSLRFIGFGATSMGGYHDGTFHSF
jgi:hypothetical protein